jgi:glycosyltransferase involved in cell wall biosynthesis
MNVCCIARTNYWQGVKGGMDLHAKMLSEGLVQRGHTVAMISTCRRGFPEQMEKNGVTYYHLKNTVFGSRRKGWPEKSIQHYLNLHKKKPFDLLWSQSFDAYGVLSIRPKIDCPPVLLRLPGSVVQEFWSVRENLNRLIKTPTDLARAIVGLFYSYFITQRPLLNYADRIVAASSVVAEDIFRWFGNGLSEKFIVVNNGVDTNRFKPDLKLRQETRQAYGISDDETLVLSLGRITYAKGHELAVGAIRMFANRGLPVRLMIAGDGPLLEELRQNVQDKGLNKHVLFTGLVENNQTPAFYNASDIFIMPTLTIEGLPFVLLEAMACEKPVVASRRGGNMTLINDHENGLFMEPGDVNDLVEKIELLINSKILSQKLASSARKSILCEYGVEQMIHRYTDIMEATVRNHSTSNSGSV